MSNCSKIYYHNVINTSKLSFKFGYDFIQSNYNLIMSQTWLPLFIDIKCIDLWWILDFRFCSFIRVTSVIYIIFNIHTFYLLNCVKKSHCTSTGIYVFETRFLFHTPPKLGLLVTIDHRSLVFRWIETYCIDSHSDIRMC